MRDHDPATYGDRIAAEYDEWAEPHLQTDATIERLAELAGAGPVLELGIGTGRVTVPLAERGLEVHGIEASEKMVERLREKPGGDRVQVTIGDIAHTDVQGEFSLILAIGDTLSMLSSQEQQQRCLERFAGKLAQAGSFVVEGIVRNADPEGAVRVVSVNEDEVHLIVVKGDPATQAHRSAHVILRADDTRIIPILGRHLPPGELDLMAALAGLRLRERWGDWEQRLFTGQSRRHVSIYERGKVAGGHQGSIVD
jgi:SAM-dependent methyltransferase